MARVTVEDCLDKIDNRFALVLLVAKRAKQILRGSEPTVSGKGNKFVVTALREVAKGNVSFEIEGDMTDDIESDLNKGRVL